MAPRDCREPDLSDLPLLLHRHPDGQLLCSESRCTGRLRGRVCRRPRRRLEHRRGLGAAPLSTPAQEVLRRDVSGSSLSHARGLHPLRPRRSRRQVGTAPGGPRDWRPGRLSVSYSHLSQRGRREEAQEQHDVHRHGGLPKPGLRLGSSLRRRSRLR